MGKEKHLILLAKLKEIQDSILDVHQLFRFSYPITIVEDDMFYIYDMIPKHNEYEFIKMDPCPFPISPGIRAAFPLESYENKISAIVTEEVFDSQEGYITILHEFVHCAQFNGCEAELKERLNISRYYQQENNYMWEITHPFPYDDQIFNDLFTQYTDALAELDINRVKMIRARLMNKMEKVDFEYLLWQEWKEGFARFIENKIKTQLNIEANHNGKGKPYNRVSFYESGSKYISLIDRDNRDIVADMKSLFFEMNKGTFLDIE